MEVICMANQGMNVQLNIKEIYSKVCPECQRIIKEMVRNQVTEQMVNNILGSEVKG